MILKLGLPTLMVCSLSVVVFITIVKNSSKIEKIDLQFKKNFHPIYHDNEILLNLKDFRYIINANCNARYLVWIVTSYAGNPAARSALRRAYTDEELEKLGIRRVFLLGLLEDKVQRELQISQSAILNESQRFKDIVQGNFIEAYRNLTYKHLMGLKWAVNNCIHAHYIMKMDDDIVLNLYDVLINLYNNTTTDDVLTGYVLKNMIPVREPANKWFVTQDDFTLNVYPDFLSGWLYISSVKIAMKLISRSQTYPKYFWIDDVFVTGILRQELGITMQDIHELYTTDYRYFNCCIKEKEKRLKCDVAIGPNGGDTDLQVRFKDFVDFCRFNCLPRTRKFNTCIVAYQEPSWSKGIAQIHLIETL